LVIPKIECIDSGDKFGHFIAEPLEKGFGVTLGNSMRRVLLSYLPGAAVTRVKIEGILHEFSTIPHVKEDAVEFLLNIKALRLKPLISQPGKLVLEVSGARQVFAGDIEPTAEYEIANPELYLATLDSDDAKLCVEFDVEIGEGYREAETGGSLPVGVIPIDAIFTPIRKVNYTIEPIHVGRETSRERLHIELWTDGTILPGDAISRSAGILMEQLTPLVNYVKVSQMKAEEAMVRASIPDEKYNQPIEQLNLSVRTMNCLRRAGIAAVGELISKEEKELLALRNFGQLSKQEVDQCLEEMGLSFSSPVEEGISDEA